MLRAYTRTTSEQCSLPNIERDGWMAMGDVVMEDLEVEEEEGYEYRNTRVHSKCGEVKCLYNNIQKSERARGLNHIE